MPNWAEQVTAIATAVSAIGLLSAIGAVIFAGQQAREARIGRQAEMAVEFFRRWSEGPMMETRRLVARQRRLPDVRKARVKNARRVVVPALDPLRYRCPGHAWGAQEIRSSCRARVTASVRLEPPSLPRI